MVCFANLCSSIGMKLISKRPQNVPILESKKYKDVKKVATFLWCNGLANV